jgi:FG-GAP-like repeat
MPVNDSEKQARRRFLRTLGVGVPMAAVSVSAASQGEAAATAGQRHDGGLAARVVDLGYAAAGDDALPLRKHTLDLGISETVAVADINKDGRLDIVSGEYWYEQIASRPGTGPRFIRHKFRELPYTFDYLEDLSDLAIDVNGDGYLDVVTCSYWAKPLTWWENPAGRNQPWREHLIDSGSPVEFVFLVDLLNTGKPLQLLPQFGNVHFPLAWYELAGPGASNPWIKHEVSSKSYGHGIGAGDVNGDGRADIITPKGWFEAPADPRHGEWQFHPEFDLGMVGFIYARDVNGDGLPDLVTTAAHDYGIFWYEQKKDSAGTRTWVKHVIDNAWSQGHAMTLADLNNDGRMELVTGKRYYAHDHDPGANEPLGIYWYEQLQTAGPPQWRRHLIEYGTRTGAGMQIAVVDIDRDGDLDIVVGGKSGLYLFENLTASHG